MGARRDRDTLLEELYAAHYVRLVRLAVLLLRDHHLAEEVVQDSFVALYPRLGEPTDLPAYLRQAVVNRARSALRHRGVVDRHAARPPTDGPPADEDALAAQTRTEVLAALAALPRRQREVIVLRYYLDLSEREIAATLGISAGAVKTHASRAAQSLRTRLAALTDQEER